MKTAFLGVVCVGVLGCASASSPHAASDGTEYHVVGKVARWTMDGKAGYSVQVLDPLDSGHFVEERLQITGPETAFLFSGKDLGLLKPEEWSPALLLRILRAGSIRKVENLGLAADNVDAIRAIRRR